MTIRCTVLICALLAAPTLQAHQTDPLRLRMGDATFNKAGLNQLTPDQLKVLEQWMSAHPNEMVDVVGVSAVPTATAVNRSTDPAADVVSRFDGSFHGWQKGAVLQLENGQRWQVSDDSMLATRHPIDHPLIHIKRAMFGGWWLEVDGYNTRARVHPAN